MSFKIGQLFAAALLLFSLAASACAARRHLLDSSDIVAAITIPSSIAVPSGNDLQSAFLGVGHQHYTFNGTQWVLQNATAKLYTIPDDKNFGMHFFLQQQDANGGQPSWMFQKPESLVTAKGTSSVTVDQDSITWNLLQETSESGSKEILGDVTYVQRLQTKGGLAPSATNGSPQNGDTHSSAYSAIYAFYAKSGGHGLV